MISEEFREQLTVILKEYGEYSEAEVIEIGELLIRFYGTISEILKDGYEEQNDNIKIE